jgi:tetratricopeptide (TPR) repeat protein
MNNPFAWEFEMKYRSFGCCCWLLSLIAIALLTGCSRDPNGRKQKYLESGQRYFEKGKYPEAIIQFGNAIQVDPRFAEAHYQMSQALIKMQDWPRAYSELNRTVDLKPESYPAHLDLANLLIAGGDFKQAKEHLDLLKDKQPSDPQVHAAFATWYAAQSDLPAASREMQAALDLDPKRWESYVNMGLLQIKTKQNEAAETNLKKAVELAPKAAGPHLTLGGFYQTTQRLAEAEQQFRDAIQAEPQNPDARSALARVYMQEGKSTETIELLRRTKQELSGNSIGYRMLGDFYFAVGDIDKATEEYASLYQEHPKDVLVKKNYVQLLILKNHLDEASKLNDEILKKAPEDSEALVTVGKFRFGEINRTRRKQICKEPSKAILTMAWLITTSVLLLISKEMRYKRKAH